MPVFNQVDITDFSIESIFFLIVVSFYYFLSALYVFAYDTYEGLLAGNPSEPRDRPRPDRRTFGARDPRSSSEGADLRTQHARRVAE